MQVDDVSCNGLVSNLVPDILDDEDAIESGQDRALEVDLLSGVLEIVIATKDGVGGCEH